MQEQAPPRHPAYESNTSFTIAYNSIELITKPVYAPDLSVFHIAGKCHQLQHNRRTESFSLSLHLESFQLADFS